MQVLHDVGIGEAIGGTWRVEVLKFLQRLIAEIVAIDQKQNALGPRFLDQPVGERTRRECLASAGRELDQRTRLVFG